MSKSKLHLFSILFAVILLFGADASRAQRLNYALYDIGLNDIHVLRVFKYWPDSAPMLQIFLKDPKAPGFYVQGEKGDTTSSYLALWEFANYLAMPVTLIYDPTVSKVEQNSPNFDHSKPYSKTIYPVYGFYPLPPSTSAPTGKIVPFTGEMQQPQAGAKIVPIPGGMQPPPAGAKIVPFTGEMQPPQAGGTCCVYGRLHEMSAEGCQNEGGVFYQDRDMAPRFCGGGSQ